MSAHEVEHIFRGEEHLQPTLREGMTTMREAELRERWIAEHPTRAYAEWRHDDSAEFRTWAADNTDVMERQCVQATAEWLRSADVLAHESRLAAAAATDPFLDADTSALWRSLRAHSLQDGSPESAAVRAEVARAAGDPGAIAGRFAEEAKELALTVAAPNGDPALRLTAEQEWEDSRLHAKLADLRGALDAWRDLAAGKPPYDADALAAAAANCRDAIIACRDATASVFFRTPSNDSVEPKLVTEVLPSYLSGVAGLVAREFRARTGDPSFTGMFDRLCEQVRGEAVEPAVNASIKASGGDYRSAWSDGRDALL
jgi:hypothetical protein